MSLPPVERSFTDGQGHQSEHGLLRTGTGKSGIVDLVAVIPVAQIRSTDALSMALFSLQKYAGEFVLSGAVQYLDDSFPTSDMDHLHLLRKHSGGFVRIESYAKDDIGNRYQSKPYLGGGSDFVWPFEVRFRPSLALSAKELVVTFAKLSWKYPDAVSNGLETIPGFTGWQFTISLLSITFVDTRASAH